jgi:hypothetical protein
VALLIFGNFKNHRDAGWVRVETDLTEDLDQVSERLFMLTSEGGNVSRHDAKLCAFAREFI